MPEYIDALNAQDMAVVTVTRSNPPIMDWLLIIIIITLYIMAGIMILRHNRKKTTFKTDIEKDKPLVIDFEVQE